jgi:hypothetical protein
VITVTYLRISIITAALLVPTFAYAGFGDVVASFPAPGEGPKVARSNQYLFVLATAQAGPQMGRRMIYRVNAETGSIRNSYLAPNEGKGNYGGIAFTAPRHLWVLFDSYDCVYKLDAPTGSLIESWLSWPGVMTGIAADHNQAEGGRVNAIWISATSPDIFRKFTPKGVLKEEYLWGIRTSDSGWDYDASLLWAGVWSWPHYVYQFSPFGSVAASFPSPAVYFPVYSCEYYEGYLWVGTSQTKNEEISYIWKVDVSPQEGVTPASVGRVKALFR